MEIRRVEATVKTRLTITIILYLKTLRLLEWYLNVLHFFFLRIRERFILSIALSQ